MTVDDVAQAIIRWLRSICGVHGPLAVSGEARGEGYHVAVTPVMARTRHFVAIRAAALPDTWQVLEVTAG